MDRDDVDTTMFPLPAASSSNSFTTNAAPAPVTSDAIDEGVGIVAEKKTPAKKTKGSKKAATTKTEDGDAGTGAGDGEGDVDGVKIDDKAKKATPKRKRIPKADQDEEADESESIVTADGSSKRPRRTPSRRASRPDSDSDLTPLSGEDSPPKKKKRKTPVRKPKEPIVYVIPEVERKETTFKGRLGYACLNTVLRNRKPAREAVFCSRTCRIDSIKKNGTEWMKEIGLQNIKDLYEMIEWNEKHHIRFMRLSSEMFPFASHPEYGYSLEYASSELEKVGELINKYGHRCTTHPGQFTQLGSPRKEVIKNSVADLKYHCEMLDRMGMGKDSVMIIHGGGMFGDKPATLERLKENYSLLPDNVKGRLVLENDELNYNVDDLLPLCESLNIPLVFDYHHDSIFPSSQTPAELMPRILATWKKKGIKPKQHLSEQRNGAVTIMERRAHSDRCKSLPKDLPDDMDLMIEAKDKEQAVFELYRIYNLEPVIHESLRPPAEVETLRTGGRKSNKRKKKAAEGEADVDDDEDGVDLDVDGDGETDGSVNLDAAGVEPVPPPEPPSARKTKTPAMRASKMKTKAGAEEGEEKKQKGRGKGKGKGKNAKEEEEQGLEGSAIIPTGVPAPTAGLDKPSEAELVVPEPTTTVTPTSTTKKRGVRSSKKGTKMEKEEEIVVGVGGPIEGEGEGEGEGAEAKTIGVGMTFEADGEGRWEEKEGRRKVVVGRSR